MRKSVKSLAWIFLLGVVIGGFFHECLFEGCSLVPNDLLYQLILPFSTSVKHVQVQNHYAFDALTADYPWGLFWQQSVQSGQVPLWNPYVFGGHPYLAGSMEAVFNPVKLLYCFVSAERAFTLGIILELFLAALTMFVFLRELERSRCAAFIGSCAFALNSAFLLWYWRVPSTFAWAPLVLLFFERATKRQSWNYALASAVALGVALVSGSIQASLHLGCLCLAYFAIRVPWRDPSQRRVALARAGAIFVLAALVAAVQLLPTLELIRAGGMRYVTDIREHARPGVRHTLLGIPFLVTLMFPGLAGSPETFDLIKVTGAGMGDFTGYIGVVPFALAVVTAVVVRDRPVRRLLFIVAAVLVIIFFTPLLKYVYHRFLIVMVFVGALLAAFGVDLLLDFSAAQAARIQRTLLWLAGGCGLVALGLVIAQVLVHSHRGALLNAAEPYVLGRAGGTVFSSKPDWLRERVGLFLDHFRLTNPVFLAPLISLPAITLLWTGYSKGRRTRTVLSGALVVLTAMDLLVVGRPWVPQVNLRQYPLFPPVPALSPALNDRSLFRVYQGSTNWLLLPNSLLVGYGLASIRGNESLMPQGLEALPNYQDGRFNRLLDLQNIKYVLTEEATELPAERFDLLNVTQGVRLYRNKTCLPRVQYLSTWRVEPNRERLLTQMTADGFDPGKLVLLEESPPIPAPASSDPSASAQIVRYDAQRVVAKVRAAVPGIVLLADTYYPGWRAQVDGQPAPILRADYVLRAVAVPGGEHELEFYFAPVSFRIGAWISLLTISGIALSGCTRLLSRNRIG